MLRVCMKRNYVVYYSLKVAQHSSLIFPLGYDPVFADPLRHGGDPGLRQQLFNPMRPSGVPDDTRWYLNDFIEAKDDMRYVRIKVIH